MNKDKRNNIKLLGTLNNADESGIIANANQIYDANEDKSTQDVSKEHTERIKTLEDKENSMQTTLENITKTGEASAASNVTYNHSDSKLDATNVQQAVDEISTKTVFDISAYHATDGTLATYDNLEDALGTDGKNIPQSLRKGGMSVKFVQSSDNKYIQARLMANAFTTDITQWRIIDNVPMARSKNLVTSGGVALIENYNFGNDIVGGVATRDGGFYNNNGSVEIRGAGAAFYCGTTDFIDVSRIDSLKIENAIVQVANTLLLVAYDGEKNPLLEYSVESEYTTWHTNISFLWVKESETIKYIRLTCQMSSNTLTITTAVNPDAYVKESFVRNIVGFYDKQKFENTIFSDSVKYIIKLDEDIVLSKNVTLPKYCVLDFNGHYIDTSSYSLISQDGCVTDIIVKRNYGYCLRGHNISGKFCSSQGIYFSNLWNISDASITTSNQGRYKNKLLAIFNCFCNTTIYLDYSISIGGATIDDNIEVLPANLIIESLGTQKTLGFFKGFTIQEGGVLIAKNIKIQQVYGSALYVAGKVELYNVNSEFSNIYVASENNILENCRVLAPIKLIGDNNVISNCICISSDSKYNICVCSNNNIIKNNKISGGIVGILIAPTATSKVIENNIIKDNIVDSVKEEAISFDWINNIGHKNLFTFDSFIDGKTLRGTLTSPTNDYTSYIGSILYGISENSLGKFCKILNITDSEVEGKVDIELDYEIFEYDIDDNVKVYNNNGVLNSKGYIDYRDTLWVIGCVFLNNLCDNNIINGGWALDISGAAFGNIITNNVINGDYGISTGRLYIAAAKSTKNGKTFNAAICKNVIKNNIIPSCRMSSIYDGTNISEGCVATSLRHNVYIGNICDNIYICDKYSYIDTGGYITRRINPPYDYNSQMFRHDGENLTPVLYSEASKMMVKGKTIVTKESDIYKIFNGQFSDDYGQEPIIEDLT